MKLLYLEIENYGNLTGGRRIDFGGALQQFNEANGYGKTTLCSFIRVMFYGMKSRRENDTSFGDREHFYPFSGGRFGGSVTFMRAGKTCRIERFFDEKSATRDRFRYFENGEEIAEKYAADASASVSVEIGDKGVSLDIYDIKHDKVRFLDKKGALVPLRNDGAYLCRRIADEYKLKAGDTFTISPYGTDKEYTLKVNGVIYSSSESVAITNAYAEACGVAGYKTDSLYTSAVKNVLLDDELTKNFEIQDKQSIVESFETFTSLLNLSVTVLIAAAIVLGVVVLYNLGVMSYTERYREMATLKVVGFKDKKIAGLLIGQNMWVTVIGVILGLPLAAGTLGYLVKELASEYEMRVVMGWKTFLISTLLTFCVSLVVSLFVAKKNKKIDMVEALKGAE